MPAVYLGRDTASRGSGSRGWGYNAITYSGGGYLQPGGPVTSLTWSGHTAFSYASVPDTERFLLLPDGVTRNTIAIAGLTSTSLQLAVALSGSAWLTVSLYCFADNSRSQTIDLKRASDGTVLATTTTPDYVLGHWYRFILNESVNIGFTLVTGGRTNVTGVYLDPYAPHHAGGIPRNAIGAFAL